MCSIMCDYGIQAVAVVWMAGLSLTNGKDVRWQHPKGLAVVPANSVRGVEAWYLGVRVHCQQYIGNIGLRI